MNPESRELFRNCLLLQLNAAGAPGVPATTLLVGAKLAGFSVTPEQIRDEVQYLADAGLCVAVFSPISPENARHRITKQGRDHLAQQGLA